MGRRAAFVGLVFLAACGGDGLSLSQQVGANGGTVAADGTGVTIPAGALPGDANVTVRSEPEAATAGGTTSVGTPAIFGPEGTKFAVPVKISFKVDRSKLPSGKTLADVVVYTAPAGTTDFRALPTSVLDDTRVEATTTHFSVLYPGVPTSSIACRVSCGGAASAGAAPCPAGQTCPQPEPTYYHNCTATCSGHTYALDCTNGACTCKTDGAQTGTTTTPIESTSAFAAYSSGCGYPGELPCEYYCGAWASGSGEPAAGSGGTGSGATSPAPSSEPVSGCGCYGSCMAKSYGVSCSNGTCTCGGGSASTGSGPSAGGTGGSEPAPSEPTKTFALACETDTSALAAAWASQCGYPGTVEPPPPEPTGSGPDGPAPSSGGSGGTSTGGTSSGG
jgi:hypothetical protein